MLVTAPVIQYRIVRGKRDEIVVGPDDADVVISVAPGRRRSRSHRGLHAGQAEGTGHTGVLLDALRSGEVAQALAALAHQAS